MRPAESRRPHRRLLGVSAAGAAVGGLAAVALGGAGPLPMALGAALAGTFLPFAVSVAGTLHEIREQQRRIVDQLETQARLLHQAARLAGELTDEPG